MRAGLACLGAGLCVLLAWSDSGSQPPNEPSENTAAHSERDSARQSGATDPLGPNAACYVCHMTFVKEPLARVHLKGKVGCIDCHGLSAKHANDENVGATKPDATYRRDQVDGSCLKCHPKHDVAARTVIARFLQRRLKDSSPICTDCHGAHKIAKALEAAAGDFGRED